MKWIGALVIVLLGLATTFLGFRLNEEKGKKRFSVDVSIDKELFRQKVAAPAPEWMLSQIRKDLAPFSERGVTPQMVNDTFKGESIYENGLVRFTIKDRHLSVGLHGRHFNYRRFRALWEGMTKLNELVPLPDVDFLISTRDGFFVDPGNFFCPIFTFSKIEGLYPFVLAPDYKAIKSYENLRGEITQASQKHSWNKKLPLIFWRGGVNGAPVRLDNWEHLPRIKLVLLSLAMPQLVDARFTNLRALNCAPPEMMKIFQQKKMAGKWVEKEDHLNYKYLIDIDGGACTYERYFWLLLSNSVVLKQVTSNQQWYYGALRPYEHYIPVKEDLSDLLAQVEWAKSHDAEAQKIAENATQFVKNNLSPEDIYLYFYHLIVEYARLQKAE